MHKRRKQKLELTIFIWMIFIIILFAFGAINIYQSRKVINTQANSNLIFFTYSIKKSVNIYLKDFNVSSNKSKNFNSLKEFLSSFKIYKLGYIYLISPENKVIFAQGYKYKDSTIKIDKDLYEFLNKNKVNGKIKLDNGKVNIITSQSERLFSITPINNDWILIVTVPANELYGAVNKLLIFTLLTLFFTVFVTTILAIMGYAKVKKINNELIHKEKLISMGKMAAEVAHEINNPLGYLNCNIDTLKKFIEKLKDFSLSCKEGFNKVLIGEHDFESQMKLVDKLKSDGKIDYIIEAIEELIDESKEGIKKVSILVANLKNFAKDDSSDNKTNENLKLIIEETLTVLNNKIANDIKIVKGYEEIPKLYCNKNQLEQVLINIIENAYFSIMEKSENYKRIGISLYQKDKNAYIEIEDNGKGIEESHLNKIFEAFFTTKEQGVGTGLGLSIAYEIITNKHNGEIQVKSKRGMGTTFIIKIPYQNKK